MIIGRTRKLRQNRRLQCIIEKYGVDKILDLMMSSSGVDANSKSYPNVSNGHQRRCVTDPLHIRVTTALTNFVYRTYSQG